MTDTHDWSALTTQQLGRYGEYITKMEFARLGFDIYSPEVDDKGIDFVLRCGVDAFYDVQVKSLRPTATNNFVTLLKSAFQPRKTLLLVVVLFESERWPDLFLIQSVDWLQPETPLAGYDYIKGKSKPEWCVYVWGKKNRTALEERFAFEKQAAFLTAISTGPSI